jgi:CheY-like chemotaxis protein
MDKEMPVMDGLQCTSKIREFEANGLLIGHVPIIAVTANARSEQIATLLEAGMVSLAQTLQKLGLTYVGRRGLEAVPYSGPGSQNRRTDVEISRLAGCRDDRSSEQAQYTTLCYLMHCPGRFTNRGRRRYASCVEALKRLAELTYPGVFGKQNVLGVPTTP